MWPIFIEYWKIKKKYDIKSAWYSKDLILWDQVAVGPGYNQHISMGSPLDPMVRYIGSNIGCYKGL